MTKEELEIQRLKEWYSWRKLYFYFEHELEEGEISETTYRAMSEALMEFKPNSGENKDEL